MSKKMSRKRSLPAPPDQPTIKAFISGGFTTWKVGDSPLVGQNVNNSQSTSSQDRDFEKEVHDSILAAGTFKHFKNQNSALAYLNGQIVVRKKHSSKMEKFEKSVSNFKKSGLTQRFMSVPKKVLPQDKPNCEMEVNRSKKVLSDLNIFKGEMIVMKKSCLDETGSVIVKRKEEFEYYSDQVSKLVTLSTELEIILYKLEKSNNHINKSRVSKSVYILENKRIMRRQKENRRIDIKDAFKRKVEGLKRFIPKYTNKSFEELFEVIEEKVSVPKNQHTKNRRSNNPARNGDFFEESDDNDIVWEDEHVVDEAGEKQIVFEIVVKEASSNQTIENEALVEESLTIETVMKDAHTNETVVKESPPNETVVKESPSNETVEKESPANKTVETESPANETIIKESSNNETVIKDTCLSEAIVKESPLNEAVEKEPSSANESDSIKSVDENSNVSVDIDGKQRRTYKHEKIVRKIKLKHGNFKLDDKDFKKLDFSKHDVKSLRLLIEHDALTSSLERLIKLKISAWELEESDKVFLEIYDRGSDIGEEIQTEGIGSLADDNQVEKDSQLFDEQVKDVDSSKENTNKNKIKKKYKKMIKQILNEHRNKIKKKKLEKEVISRAEEFDKEDANKRKEKFEKYLFKIENVEVSGKYVNLNISQ